eukprot:TRINITY_DN10619_c0_g1_i1.p1 TRINITY_DN10619_c0_g1~~TRINITY_DN10619_c0_g1_i1.p1  ORF type:complete len:406 (-),score=77.04 TRINITY_DN10619_c0_g1_i1:131-1348(-)
MKSFDAFSRPVQEFQVKTNFGGYLSVCSFSVIAILFFTELRYFLAYETKDQMIIDQEQDHKYFNVTINVTFPKVPCSVLHMNLIDAKKANVLHVATQIYKTRLSSSGQRIGRRIRDSLANVVQTSADMNDASAGNHTARISTAHNSAHLRCNTCYQSHISEDDCCSTCGEVRQAFQSRGLNTDAADYVFVQCVGEAYRDAPAQRDEGCHVDANLYVRKVAATVHFGVGKFLQDELTFLAERSPKEFLSTLDFSHNIKQISFGEDFPGLVKVLDGREKSNHKPGMSEHYQYDVHVIPTTYLEDGQSEIKSHQYSVTEYVKSIDMLRRHAELLAVGVWMNYDFTPFEVKVTKSRKPFSHFLTECCAILGGIFAFTGMLDNFVYSIGKTMHRSKGKGGLQLTAMGPED